MHRFAKQFASKPWDELAADGHGADAADTPESRRKLLNKATVLLQHIFQNEPLAAPLLETDFLNSLLGTFELVNMCISLPHPLRAHGEELCKVIDSSTLGQISKL